MNWIQELRKFEALDYESEPKWQLGSQFMNAVGQQFLQSHQLVQNRTDHVIEIREPESALPKLRRSAAIVSVSLRRDARSARP